VLDPGAQRARQVLGRGHGQVDERRPAIVRVSERPARIMRVFRTREYTGILTGGGWCP